MPMPNGSSNSVEFSIRRGSGFYPEGFGFYPEGFGFYPEGSGWLNTKNQVAYCIPSLSNFLYHSSLFLT